MRAPHERKLFGETYNEDLKDLLNLAGARRLVEGQARRDWSVAAAALPPRRARRD